MNAKYYFGAAVFAITATLAMPGFAADHREAPLSEEDISIDIYDVGPLTDETAPTGDLGVVPSETAPTDNAAQTPSLNPAKAIRLNPTTVRPGAAVPVSRIPKPGR